MAWQPPANAVHILPEITITAPPQESPLCEEEAQQGYAPAYQHAQQHIEVGQNNPILWLSTNMGGGYSQHGGTNSHCSDSSYSSGSLNSGKGQCAGNSGNALCSYAGVQYHQQ